MTDILPARVARDVTHVWCGEPEFKNLWHRHISLVRLCVGPMTVSKHESLRKNGATYLVCVPHPEIPSISRFFASVMLKTMIAHVLVNYDVKMKSKRTHSADHYIAGVFPPDPEAEVVFRKRCT